MSDQYEAGLLALQNRLEDMETQVCRIIDGLLKLRDLTINEVRQETSLLEERIEAIEHQLGNTR